jgi:hypothetical protein
VIGILAGLIVFLLLRSLVGVFKKWGLNKLRKDPLLLFY